MGTLEVQVDPNMQNDGPKPLIRAQKAAILPIFGSRYSSEVADASTAAARLTASCSQKSHQGTCTTSKTSGSWPDAQRGSRAESDASANLLPLIQSQYTVKGGASLRQGLVIVGNLRVEVLRYGVP